MERSQLELKRETLERIYRDNSWSNMQTSPLLMVITKIWQHLSVLFNKKNNVIVRQHSDRYGKTFWNAYDPVTGCSKDFDTTADLLGWIEHKAN